MSLIQVQRVHPRSSVKKRRPLWLVWVGEQFLELKDIWTQYARRFERRKCVGFPRLFHFAVGVDHWYRFAKQRLHWTLPSLTTAKQCQRWSDLMPLMTWQLWLASDLVKDHHLPWQSSQKNLTPGRVAQSLLPLLVEIDTPTKDPQPRGKSILLETSSQVKSIKSKVKSEAKPLRGFPALRLLLQEVLPLVETRQRVYPHVFKYGNKFGFLSPFTARL